MSNPTGLWILLGILGAIGLVALFEQLVLKPWQQEQRRQEAIKNAPPIYKGGELLPPHHS